MQLSEAAQARAQERRTKEEQEKEARDGPSKRRVQAISIAQGQLQASSAGEMVEKLMDHFGKMDAAKAARASRKAPNSDLSLP